MKFSQKTRDIIHRRAKGRCELCGLPVIDPQIHHRRPRGMGGTKRQESGSPSNGLLVHLKCHALMESQRHEALMNGWLVRQDQDPREVPVRRWDSLVLLGDDGSVTPLDQVTDVNGSNTSAPSEGIPDTISVGVVVDHSADAAIREP